MIKIVPQSITHEGVVPSNSCTSSLLRFMSCRFSIHEYFLSCQVRFVAAANDNKLRVFAKVGNVSRSPQFLHLPEVQSGRQISLRRGDAPLSPSFFLQNVPADFPSPKFH